MRSALCQLVLSKLQSYHATFKQVTLDGSGQVAQRVTGQIYLKRPGLFRWETHGATTQIMIAKQDTLWTYDVDLQQVTKQKLNSANDLATRLLVGDSAKILRDFVVKETAKDTYLLTPKSKSNIKNVLLKFHGNVMYSMNVNNSYDQKTSFVFSNIKFNQPVSMLKFATKWPDDVDVVEAG